MCILNIIAIDFLFIFVILFNKIIIYKFYIIKIRIQLYYICIYNNNMLSVIMTKKTLKCKQISLFHA